MQVFNISKDTYTIWLFNPVPAQRRPAWEALAQLDTKRRNPGVTGDGWQLRRFDPVDPSTATAICLAEGEKDASILAAAGLIAFTAPRGAQSLPLADFTELVDLAKATALPVLPVRR